MNILNCIKNLRDDIRAWTANNIRALNDKLDNKLDMSETVIFNCGAAADSVGPGINPEETPTDQNAIAGAYVADGTFSVRRYTWDEMVARCDLDNYEISYQFVEIDKEYVNIYSPDNDVIVPDSAFIVTEDSYEYYEISLVEMGGNNVILPKNTTHISSWTREPIDTIYIKATVPPRLDGEFSDEVTRIVVPTGCSGAYKSSTNWSIYADCIIEGTFPI